MVIRTRPALAGEKREDGGGELGRTRGVHVVPGRDDPQRAAGQPGGRLLQLVLRDMAARPAADDQRRRRDLGQPIPPGRVGIVELIVDGTLTCPW